MNRRPKQATQGNGQRASAYDRQATLIAAAASLFAAKGFNGTTTKAIAKAAHVSEALVFKHFPTKRTLYAAILAEKVTVNELIEPLEDAAKKHNDHLVFTIIASYRIRPRVDSFVVGFCGEVMNIVPGAIGKTVPGHNVETIDEQGEILRPGETGEIAVRSFDPVMFLEYWNEPEATKKKFLGDWMRTGDFATKDKDGYFWFVGRDDDVINTAGHLVGPL